MKYIFVAGAPGSKWSSVVKNIYYSPDIDRSDYSESRTYWHDAPGSLELMHLGAYFDPGMEFGNGFCKLHEFSPGELEKEFDRPFNGQGVRIIKSHVFCHHLDYLHQHWPDCPIVMVHRPNDACLGWWVKCGHFNITYPSYDQYYVDLRTMSMHIEAQNFDLQEFKKNKTCLSINDNRDLCAKLGIEPPPAEYRQDYGTSDISVTVFK